GASSLKQADFPKWVDSGFESARGLHAIKVLENKKDFTLESLNSSAYDTYLTWFDKRLTVLIKAWDSMPDGDALKTKTAPQIAVLRSWDQRWAVDSVATSVAVYWGQEMVRKFPREANRPSTISLASVDDKYLASVRQDYLFALVNASDKLTADFGKWQTPWGDVNRFQRLNDDIVHPFTDAGPSIPVGFTSAVWGSLASFGARPYKGSKKIYGTSGNSFVSVVEFGPKIRAKAVTAGGESGNPASKHFNDQAQRYATGNLREVYFYPAQLKGHTEREYKPGN
ncbi:MAG TPA: penicillin acylase family protein, partial [Pyrinomonadaceae bacterium]|nr:penicillin acylase family protein [Pyrinomonadaceae bacterium]